MTAQGDDFDLEALDRRFEAALARSRELPAALSPVELATLALPPFWTEPALRAVFDQPGEAEAVLAKARPILQIEGEDGQRSISLREPNAAMLVANLRDHRDLDHWAAIGGKVARVAELPPVLGAWAGLAQSLADRSDYELSRELIARVSAACAAGRPGDVQDLVEGAAALARGLGPPLSGAVRVAQHRIQRWYAVQRDRRKLLHFVPRRDAVLALDRLLDDRDPAAPWALHYIGAAGMGKTSLIRHLATEIAVSRELSVARIDFDHLSPAYPAHEPGQLIASLAYELTALIETESQDKLIGFVESALDQLRGLARLGAADLHALLDSREMQELMAWFGSLLQSFARPVLVLDTCEELTKLEAAGGAIPSVEATFVMLERLHAQAPQLRVVLAGRRLLAGAYANWAASDEIARRAGVAASRPFMALHELRGFDGAEARSFLDKRLPPARRTDEPLIDKLLALSPEPLRVSAFAETNRSPEDRAKPEPHHNPFDLTRYAEWVEADPDVQLAELDAADIDPYVEVRIVARMGDLEPLLPAIVLLRRFDLAMLTPALPAGSSPQAMFDKLARHEWLRTTSVGGRIVLEVDRGLPARIEHCIAASRGPELLRARTVLGDALRRMVETGSVMEIPVEVYDAALRILPPDAAAALWRDIEARIGNEADWEWGAKLTRDLIAEGCTGERADELVGLAIRATHASAIIHAGAGGDVDALWREIERGAASVLERVQASDRDGAVRHGPGVASPVWLLRQRARLGRVAASAAAATGGDQAALVGTIAQIVDELARSGESGALASSRCAAIEAVVELAERDPERAAPELAALIDHLAFDQPALAAFGDMLRTRIKALASRGTHSMPVLPNPVPELPATVLDWRPPDSLRDRLRLELVRRFELLDLSSDPTYRAALRDWAQTWRSWADGATATIDGDRLRSAVVTVLGSGAQTSAAVAIDAAADTRCAVHRQFPPFLFAHGRVALARGELAEARAVAHQLPRPWAQRLSCEIARWTRLPEDLSEAIFVDGLDAETMAAIADARAIVEGVAPPAKTSWSAMPSAPAATITIDELGRLHASVRGEALRLWLRTRVVGGGDLPAASSERVVMTAIEVAEVLDLGLSEAALRLFAWAAEGAAQQALSPARLRATFGAWLASMHAGDEPAAARAAEGLREQLRAFPEHDWPAYRRAIAQRASPMSAPAAKPPPAMHIPAKVPIAIGPQKTVALQPSEGVVSVARTEFAGDAPGAAAPARPPARPTHKLLRWVVVGIGVVVSAIAIAISLWLPRATPSADSGPSPAYMGPPSADSGVNASLSPDHMNPPVNADAGVPEAHADTNARVPDSHGGVSIAGGILIIGGLLIGGSLLISRKLRQSKDGRFVADGILNTVSAPDKRAPHSLPVAAGAVGPLQSPAAKATATTDPEPRAVIVVTELSADMTEVAIQTHPDTGKSVRGKASIGMRGMWPELVDRSFERALAALADAAGRDSIALEPSPQLAPRCWEGTLYNLVPHAAARLAFHRVLPATQMRRSDHKPAQIEANGSLGALLVRAWKDTPGIVHVVRRFNRTRQGDVNLTVDYGRDVPAPIVRSMTQQKAADARLLIMQCDPSMAELSTWASASESELAREYVIGRLRRASAHGLVIPAVPARLLEEFTERLVAGVGGCTRAELIEAVRDLRAYLRGRDCAAYELTLFLRGDQND